MNHLYNTWCLSLVINLWWLNPALLLDMIFTAWHLFAIPTPKKSGAVKMAAVGPVQGTSMGSMAPLNTSSSVTGATTWFLSHTASPAHNLHNWTSGTIKVRSFMMTYTSPHAYKQSLIPPSCDAFLVILTEVRLQFSSKAFRVVNGWMNKWTQIKHLVLRRK